MDFEQTVAVVTGAASGIGKAMVTRFAQLGARVVLADVEQPALDDAVRELSDSGYRAVLGCRTDVTSYEAVKRLAETAADAFGPVNLLCNNAGVGGAGRISALSLEDWRWVLDVNVWGVIHGIHAFLPQMLSYGGYIVNTASRGGLVGTPDLGPYCASKASVVAISEVLYREMRADKHPVGVSVLCPGLVNTRIVSSARNRPSQADLRGRDPEAVQRRDAFRANLQRAGMDPLEVADKVVAAIRARQFWILTHPDDMDRVWARNESLRTQGELPD